MVTQNDIAKRCGVSLSAVSAAFKRPNQISRANREKIIKTAKELGYFTKTLEGKNIGLIFNNFYNHFSGEFYNEIIYGILQRLSELKLRVQIFETIPDEYAEICEMNGFIVVGKSSEIFISKVLEYNLPHVLVDCTGSKYNSPLVYFDNLKGVKQLTEYILNARHCRIALITGEKDQNDITWKNFQKGLAETFEKYNLPFRKPYLSVYQADYDDVQTVEIAINQILSQKEKITCLMCTNDLLAYFAYQILEKYEIKISRDISITGFDGITIPRFIKKPIPQLTTVYADRIELGKKAVDLLLDVLQKSKEKIKNISLDTELKIGDSVRRVK